MITTLALIACFGGVILLYVSWRKPRETASTLASTATVISGWLLLATSFALFVYDSGATFGSTYFVLALPMLSWLLVLYQAKRQQSKQQNHSRTTLKAPNGHAIGWHSLRLVVALPLAGITSILLCILLCTALPWSLINQIAFGVVVMPVIWGGLMVWSTALEKPTKPAIAMTIASALCAAVLLG